MPRYYVAGRNLGRQPCSFLAVSEVCVVGMAHVDGIARRYTDAKWQVIGSCESMECHVEMAATPLLKHVPKLSSNIELCLNSIPMLQHILPRKK